MSKALITSRDPKGLQVVRLFEDAYNKAELDDESAQRINERGGEFQNGITELIVELSVSNQFADEEIESSCGYLSGYEKPKGITVQTDRLRELFPDIGYADKKLIEQPFSVKAEGWFAIPKWEKLASTYGEAVQKVLDMIKKTREGKFQNYREGHLGPEYLRQHAKTARMFQVIADQQRNHDILVVPCQFGILHRGKSVRRAREVMNSSEFGLGAFAVGIMLLTHPERLQHHDDLWIDCAGDEYSSEADGSFESAPGFSFDGGRVGFDAIWFGSAGAGCGSASAFWQ